MENKITKLRIGKAKVVIYINDKRMDIAKGAYLETRPYVGKVLTKKEIKELIKRTEIDPYYEFSVKQLTLKSVSTKELSRKLKKKKLKDDDIAYVFSLLNKNKIINEEKSFLEMVRKLESKCYGKFKIKEVLSNKGFELKRIDSLIFIDKKELKKAIDHLPRLKKKYQKYNYVRFKTHIAQSLVRLGFDLKTVNEALSTLEDKDELDEEKKIKNDYKYIKDKYIKNHCDKDLDKRVIKYLMNKGYSYSDIERIRNYEVD